MTIFHHLQFRATLTTILHTSQNPHVLHISRFPRIDTARRRERTSEMDLAKTPSRAGEMQIFDLEGTFPRKGLPKNPNASAHTTDLHQMLFSYRKNPIVWPHCLGKKRTFTKQDSQFLPFVGRFYYDGLVWPDRLLVPWRGAPGDQVVRISACAHPLADVKNLGSGDFGVGNLYITQVK